MKSAEGPDRAGNGGANNITEAPSPNAYNPRVVGMVFSNADRAFLQLLLVHSDKADLKCAGALASGRCIAHIQRPSETQGGRTGGVGQIGPAGDRLASIGGCRREGHTRWAGRRTRVRLYASLATASLMVIEPWPLPVPAASIT